MLRRWLLALIGGGLALSGFAGPGMAGEEHPEMAGTEERVFVESRFSYPETMKRLKAAIRAQGMRVMFVDDQQATLRQAGVKSPGAAIIAFFNTRFTKRIFEIDYTAHMEIPLRIDLTVLGLAVQPVGAVEYRLQVTHLDHRNFFAHLEHSPRFWRGDESMGRLEARLDKREFPTGAVIPGREVQLLQDPSYGGKPPARLAVLPATKDQAWTTLAWEGNPGGQGGLRGEDRDVGLAGGAGGRGEPRCIERRMLPH